MNAKPMTETKTKATEHLPYILGILGGLAIMALALLSSGCTTTSTVTTNPDGTTSTNLTRTVDVPKTTNTIYAVVPPAVRLAVQLEPGARQYLNEVSLGIITFTKTSADDLHPDDLTNFLAGIPVPALQRPETQAAIDAGLALYRVYFWDAVAAGQGQRQWLIPVLQSLAGAIQKGLTQ